LVGIVIRKFSVILIHSSLRITLRKAGDPRGFPGIVLRQSETEPVLKNFKELRLENRDSYVMAFVDFGRPRKNLGEIPNF
jgi:hypothetical protein